MFICFVAGPSFAQTWTQTGVGPFCWGTAANWDTAPPNGASAAAAFSALLVLNGATHNMTNNNIGTAAAPMTIVDFLSGTLANVDGINSGADVLVAH